MRAFFILYIIFYSGTLSGQGEEIIEKHLDDYGQSIWDQVNTLKVEGKLVTKDYKAYPLSITLKQEGKTRVEGANQQGRSLRVSSGFDFWMSGPGLQDANEPVEKLITQNAMTIGSPLSKYRDKIVYHGFETLNSEVYHTFRSTEGSITVAFYLDRNTCRLVHQRASIYFGADTYEVLISYDKYKSHQGLLHPTAIYIKSGEEFREWVLDETLVGVGVSDALFENPNSQ